MKQLKKLKNDRKLLILEIYDVIRTEKDFDIIFELVDDYIVLDKRIQIMEFVIKRFNH